MQDNNEFMDESQKYSGSIPEDVKVIKNETPVEVVEITLDGVLYYMEKHIYEQNLEAGNTHIVIFDEKVYMLNDREMLDAIEKEQELSKNKK